MEPEWRLRKIWKSPSGEPVFTFENYCLLLFNTLIKKFNWGIGEDLQRGPMLEGGEMWRKK
ncbi:hypothetical protein FB480_11051 [Agrobacterium vitis]|nr:hypothetical protein FB480_11051 [Agrobacterium vitis]